MITGQKAVKPYDIAKRIMDVLVSIVALLLTGPIQAVVALLVGRKLGRPILFRQQRPGKDALPFTLYKFRTMVEPDPSAGLVSSASRLTPFGVKLRSTSLDELPTLWNVLRGDMSVVGPRPLKMSYLALYTPEQARRHEVRPGVTGLAQVSGRNSLSWEQKFAADVRYVNERGLRLDLLIMLKTVAAVIRRQGIAPEGQDITPEFTRGGHVAGTDSVG